MAALKLEVESNFASLQQLNQQQQHQDAERARQRINDGARAVRDRLGEEPEAPPRDRLDAALVVPGARVRVRTLGKDGVVADTPDRKGRVHVEVDGLRVRVDLSDLEQARVSSKAAASGKKKGGKGKKQRGGRGSSPPRSSSEPAATGCDTAFRSVDNTLDLRGERVEEAATSCGEEA